MSAVLSHPGAKPPPTDWPLTQLVIFALYIGAFIVLVRGCGSTAQAPEPRFQLVPDIFPTLNVARSN
jgi:hypothetical protein